MTSQHTLSCTLLVPQDLFQKVVGPYRVASTLAQLLLRHEWEARGKHHGERVTTRYQEPNRCLRKVGFRVSPVLWHKLGCYARVLGVSRCLAFVMLMEAELTRDVDVGTLPGKRYRKNWRRQYLLYYELVGIGSEDQTILRRRKYVDTADQARLKRMYQQFEEP